MCRTQSQTGTPSALRSNRRSCSCTSPRLWFTMIRSKYYLSAENVISAENVNLHVPSAVLRLEINFALAHCLFVSIWLYAGWTRPSLRLISLLPYCCDTNWLRQSMLQWMLPRRLGDRCPVLWRERGKSELHRAGYPLTAGGATRRTVPQRYTAATLCRGKGEKVR